MLYIVRFFLLQTFTFAISVPGIPYVFFLEKREDLQKKFDVHDSKEFPRPEKKRCIFTIHVYSIWPHSCTRIPATSVCILQAYRLINQIVRMISYLKSYR